MKKAVLFLILNFPVLLFAQTEITIVESRTEIPIPGVIVKAQGFPNQVSDINGQVNFNLTEPTILVFSHIAFDTRSLQVQPNTETVVRLNNATNALSEVIVTGFESERPLLKQAGAISRVTENELYRFNEASIVNAFNTKPGIRVEERAPASYRISIRGSSLRSPFGVRNVKVYWNEIPFTAPDGTTALNILDLSNIQNTEIIKGPAGSIYGAGNGGVISFTSRQQIDENRISAELNIGEFGLVRYRFGIQQQLENGGFSVSYVSQKSDGYREHSAVDRQVLQIAANFDVSDKQKLSTQILYSDLDYQIPGALNETQLQEDRTQARPGSVRQNSSIAQKTLYGMLTHDYRFNEAFENVTALYMNTTDFENPFILDYKKETSYSYGGRTKFTHNGQWGAFPIRLIAGGEFQLGKTLAQNFGNVDGNADTLRFSDDLITVQSFLFQQLEIEWTEDILMTFGFSENFSRYNIDRLVDNGPNSPSNNVKRFDPVIVPRIALAWQITNNTGVHGSISSGFSPPTIDEVRTNEGSINLDLEAEKGINYEVGYRAQYGILNLDITGFYFKLDQTITSFTNPQGVVLFRNAGATDQKGIELQLDYALFRNQLSTVQEIKLTHAFTGHYFEFTDYSSGGNDFSGNQLTGVAHNTLVNQLDIRTKPGFYLNFTHQFVDEIPLNDANTVYQDVYHLVGSRLGWRNTLGRWDLEAYAGVDNLSDESYSLGNDLNAFGGRYYQPAPGRNFYGGVKVGFRY